MKTLGAKLVRVDAGAVDIELTWRDEFTQQGGVLHAGVIASVADSACGYAALSMMPTGSEVVSIEFKLNLLAPARGERFVARGRVVRAGRTITVATAEVFSGDTPVATMTGTMMRVSGAPLANRPAGGTMPRQQKQGGPSQGRKDEPTADRSHRNAGSRDELKARSVKGDKPGAGRRNGSAKKR